MTMMQASRFPELYKKLDDYFQLRASEPIHTKRWQGVDISKKPDMAMHELLNVTAMVPLYGIETLQHWQFEVCPNLPWADDHFEERVGGQPLNPGKEWANWPYAKSADTFRDGGQFNHTYMERFWPRYAGRRVSYEGEPILSNANRGIRHEYGDLESVVNLLEFEPDTRQAWLPIFFPEDTGVGDGGRKPCTLGYQVIIRDGKAHMYYPLRSCDYVRHMKDDIYLAIRLLIWVIDQCRLKVTDEELHKFWQSVKPGTFTIHMTSLHMFRNDYLLRYGPGGQSEAKNANK